MISYGFRSKNVMRFRKEWYSLFGGIFLGVVLPHLPSKISEANFGNFNEYLQILVDFQSILIDFLSISITFSQFQSLSISFSQFQSVLISLAVKVVFNKFV